MMATFTVRAFTASRTAPRPCAPMRMQRGALQVVAAEEAAAPAKVKKEPKKLPPAMDPAVKRAMLHEERRQHNKAFKSAAATRVKKVLKMCEELKASPPKSEADLAPLQVLISDAYKAIDKAVNRGILHENTGARRKARVAKHRRELLMAAGLYTPKPEEPGFRKYSMMQAAAAPAPAQTAA